MAVRLSDILAQKSTVKVSFRGFTFDVEYKPNVVTPSFYESVFQDETPYRDQLEKALSCIVVDWGIKDEDGNTLPLTKEGMQDLSTPLLEKIYMAAVKDIRNTPTDEEKKS